VPEVDNVAAEIVPEVERPPEPRAYEDALTVPDAVRCCTDTVPAVETLAAVTEPAVERPVAPTTTDRLLSTPEAVRL